MRGILPAGPSTPRPCYPPAVTSETPPILKVAIPFYGIVALFAFGYALFGPGLRALVGEQAPSPAHLLAALGVGVALVLLARVGAGAWAPMGRMRDSLADLLGPVGTGTVIGLALLSGIVEEMLFRGALWPHLELVGTTLLFGLVHVLPRRSLWVYPLFALVAGLLLGLLREGSGSVVPPAIAHVIVNGANLVWIGRLAKKRLEATEQAEDAAA